MSMIRSYTPADALTIGNAACGTIAIFLCLDYIAADNRRFLWTAFILLPLALVCDVLDGYVARMNKRRQSVLGADLDSLADIISFGVAPAMLGFTLGLRGGWDMLVLTLSHAAGMRENGAPIWAVISLTRDGDTLTAAEMLERSQTIKRGVGKKQP